MLPLYHNSNSSVTATALLQLVPLENKFLEHVIPQFTSALAPTSVHRKWTVVQPQHCLAMLCCTSWRLTWIFSNGSSYDIRIAEVVVNF